MRDHLYDEGSGFDPFRYNETATVGLLVAAAGRAGLYALPEFTEDNRKLPDGRLRAGRCDLWIASEDWEIDWLIEFKLGWYGPRARANLTKPMNAAIRCALARDPQEANERWACVVYVPRKRLAGEMLANCKLWESYTELERLAASVDLAFEIDGSAGPVHMLMKRIPRGARNINLDLLDPDLLQESVGSKAGGR